MVPCLRYLNISRLQLLKWPVLTGIIEDGEIIYKISKFINKAGLDGSLILNIFLKRLPDFSVKKYLRVI